VLVGIAMSPLPFPVVGAILIGAIAFAFVADIGKIPVFKRLGIA
jgi:hypothetical protein